MLKFKKFKYKRYKRINKKAMVILLLSLLGLLIAMSFFSFKNLKEDESLRKIEFVETQKEILKLMLFKELSQDSLLKLIKKEDNEIKKENEKKNENGLKIDELQQSVYDYSNMINNDPDFKEINKIDFNKIIDLEIEDYIKKEYPNIRDNEKNKLKNKLKSWFDELIKLKIVKESLYLKYKYNIDTILRIFLLNRTKKELIEFRKYFNALNPEKEININEKKDTKTKNKINEKNKNNEPEIIFNFTDIRVLKDKDKKNEKNELNEISYKIIARIAFFLINNDETEVLQQYNMSRDIIIKEIFNKDLIKIINKNKPEIKIKKENCKCSRDKLSKDLDIDFLINYIGKTLSEEGINYCLYIKTKKNNNNEQIINLLTQEYQIDHENQHKEKISLKEINKITKISNNYKICKCYCNSLFDLITNYIKRRETDTHQTIELDEWTKLKDKIRDIINEENKDKINALLNCLKPKTINNYQHGSNEPIKYYPNINEIKECIYKI